MAAEGYIGDAHLYAIIIEVELEEVSYTILPTPFIMVQTL